MNPGPCGGPTDDTVMLDRIPLHSTNLLTVLDADGVIRYESPAIERIFGFDQDDLRGTPVSDYLHTDDRDEVMDAFGTIVESDPGCVESVEYRHEQADGTYCWVESVGNSDATPAGQYVINTRDVSERREREQRLQRTNERLTTFASTVSHDLRNPLNVARGRLELLAERHESAHVDGIRDAHDRMEALIENLLGLAQAGEDVGDAEPVRVDRIASSCWKAVETRDATLDVETEMAIAADRQRLSQLLENLFRNAVNHAGADVHVTVGSRETGFYVADDGPGIPRASRDAIFDAGHSGNDGTGIGLTIVERIADAHGWETTVRTSNTGGARFDFTEVSRVES